MIDRSLVQGNMRTESESETIDISRTSFRMLPNAKN
jgi:hypothetical protein